MNQSRYDNLIERIRLRCQQAACIYKFSSDTWPERLLPLCSWGCAITTHIDVNTECIFQYGGGNGYILLYVAASLEEWLERWLAGENLQFL